MTITDDVAKLCHLLDWREGAVRGWEQRYNGDVELSFIPASTRKKLGDRLQRLSINFAALACDTLAERLRLEGFLIDGKPDLDLWQRFVSSGMDEGAGQVHTDALALGSSYVSAWADPSGMPVALPEHPAQVVVTTNPVTRQAVSGLKRWTDGGNAYAVHYSGDKITALRSKATVSGDPTAPTAWSIGSIPADGWTVTGSIANPLGVVPLVPFLNSPRLTEPYGTSYMAPISDLNDALTKIMVDMLVTSEASAQPRRWATGVQVELDENGNPYDPWDGRTTTAQSEDPETKFGQFSPADLAAYKTAAELLVRQIGALSGLPPQMLGLHADSAMSADAVRAAEATLIARAEQRQKSFGRSWAQVAALMVGIRDNRDPRSVNVVPVWGDCASRSVAQEADAAVKLHASGILSTAGTLARLGYGPDDIAAEMQLSAAEEVRKALVSSE